MSSLKNKYRTSDIHDVMEIERNWECSFNPEPTTIPAVGLYLIWNDLQMFMKNCEKHADYLALVDIKDNKYTYKQYFEQAIR